MPDPQTTRAVLDVAAGLHSLSWLLECAADERPDEIAGGLGVMLGLLREKLETAAGELLRPA